MADAPAPVISLPNLRILRAPAAHAHDTRSKTVFNTLLAILGGDVWLAVALKQSPARSKHSYHHESSLESYEIAVSEAS